MALADLLLVMQEGRIVDQGDPERVYTRPATRFSATFMGENTLLEADVERVSDGIATVTTALGVLNLERPEAVSGRALVTIRPENLRIGAAAPDHVLLGTGTVTETVFQGSYRKVTVEAGSGQAVTLKLPADERVEVGDEVALHAHPRHIGILPQE